MLVPFLNMTALPPWVLAGLAVDGVSDNHRVSERPTGDTPAPSDATLLRDLPFSDNGRLSDTQYPTFNLNVSLETGHCSLAYTITREEMEKFPISICKTPYFQYPMFRSYWTCQLCPQPLGRLPEVFGYLKRCTECNRKAQRRKRANRTVARIDTVCSFVGTGVRWVTLTMPNVEDRVEGLKTLKLRFKALRRRAAYSQKVIGSADFYEWTQNEEDYTWNVHYHGLWIGDYWKQEDLQNEWGYIVHIAHAGSRRKRVNYCVHYAKKQELAGIRAQQLTGCLYGRAFAEIESQVTLLAELSDAENVHD